MPLPHVQLPEWVPAPLREALGESPLALWGTALVLALTTLLILRSLGGKPSKPAKAAPAKRELRGYSRAEVAKHTSDSNLWIAIRDRKDGVLKVYDVTEYIEDHPGGDSIFTHAGGDATEGFHGPQHPPTVFDLITTYHIGHILE